MKTTIMIEPMSPDSMFAGALKKLQGDNFDFKNCYEMFVTTEHPTKPGIKTITNFPITPDDEPGFIEKINFGVDFTRKKMQEYMNRGNRISVSEEK